MQDLEGKIQKIQLSAKIENGNGTKAVINEVEDFISKVKTIPDEYV